MNEYEPHPIAEIFPMMDAETFEAFKADIQANGIREPIVIWQGQILDGRNRYKACTELKLPFVTKGLPEGADSPADAVNYVISANLHRRHLNTSQRAAIAGQLANMKLGDNQHTKEVGPPNGGPSQPPISMAAAATAMNVSQRSAERAAAIHKKDPELHQQVKAGKTTVGAAEKKLRGKEQAKPKPPKGKSVPKAADAPLERKGTPAKDLTAQLEPCFKALWQLSVDLKKSAIRDWADKVERALEKKGIVPASERQRDAKGYLARIKPKADKPDAEPKPATDVNGQVDEIVSRILIEDEEFRRLLEALDPEQAIEGDLKTDDHMAALKIREAAIRNGISPLATEQLATIRKALNVVMRRYGICRKERRDEARQAAPAAIAVA